ncbi:MAG: tetratricopeptide repeat protein [Thermoleophilia bacterium]
MKWLLLIPVLAVALALGYLIPTKLLSSDGGSADASADKQQNPALQVQLADVQDRITAYEALLQRNPGDLDALRGLGDSYLEEGQAQGENNQTNDSYRSYKNAVDQYRKYLAIKPDFVEVRIDMGLSYSYLQMIDISLRELNTCVTAAPDNQRAWHSLGWVQYNGAGNLTAAKDAWQKSYDLNPSTPIGQESKSFLDEFAGQSLAVPGTGTP